MFENKITTHKFKSYVCTIVEMYAAQSVAKADVLTERRPYQARRRDRTCRGEGTEGHKRLVKGFHRCKDRSSSKAPRGIRHITLNMEPY
jgi:hypothetical protein